MVIMHIQLQLLEIKSSQNIHTYANLFEQNDKLRIKFLILSNDLDFV